MLFHHKFYDGETDSGAFIFSGTVKPLEEAEDFLGLRGIEADAVVADPDDVLGRRLLAADGDGRCGRMAGKLQRIVQQGGQGLTDADWFAVEIGEGEIHGEFRFGSGQQLLPVDEETGDHFEYVEPDAR
mgnify:CR=1 FL=1